MSPDKHEQQRIIIAFGANLGDREKTAQLALTEINKTIGTVLKTSALIESMPLVLPDESPDSHPWFLNAIWIAETTLAPEACLEELLRIEQRLGRVRLKRWGPRLIDLDLIAYEDVILQSATLTLPHPEMYKRTFVLEPLCQIWPEWMHPIIGLSARQLLDKLI